MSIKHTAQKKSATNKTLILNTNTHFISTQKGCLQWFFVQDCACNTRKGPFLLFTVQIMGALSEEGGTLKNKSVSGNVLLGAIFRVCYCFDHTTHFPAAGYGGREADLWRWKWAQEKYGLETISTVIFTRKLSQIGELPGCWCSAPAHLASTPDTAHQWKSNLAW